MQTKVIMSGNLTVKWEEFDGCYFGALPTKIISWINVKQGGIEVTGELASDGESYSVEAFVNGEIVTREVAGVKCYCRTLKSIPEIEAFFNELKLGLLES